MGVHGYALRCLSCFEVAKTCNTIFLMAVPSRPRVQLDISTPIRDRAKAVAYGRGMTLVELVLHALKKEGDSHLTKLIEKDLAERAKRGRPEK